MCRSRWEMARWVEDPVGATGWDRDKGWDGDGGRTVIIDVGGIHRF